MTDENVNDETSEETAEPGTTDAPDGVADVENVPDEAAPEESEATEQEDAPAEEPADEQVAEAEPPTEEPTAEAEDPQPDEPQPAEPVAEGGAQPEEAASSEEVAPATEPEPRGEAAQPEPEPEPESRNEAAQPEPEPEPESRNEAAQPEPKRKRKRLPRSLRRQRSKPQRERPAERKAITRLPKPEHARGRRQERQGTVVSAGADKTIVVRVDVMKVHPMYKKVVKRSTKLHAHDETNEAKVGDIVRLVETRPLSKMKRWRLQEVVEAAK
jgi:small subunit ribosomal protein S17